MSFVIVDLITREVLPNTIFNTYDAALNFINENGLIGSADIELLDGPNQGIEDMLHMDNWMNDGDMFGMPY